jgi:hypothetical protein
MLHFPALVHSHERDRSTKPAPDFGRFFIIFNQAKFLPVILLPIRVKTGCHWEYHSAKFSHLTNFLTVAEQVLIEFVVDSTQIETALEKLEKTGSVDLELSSAFKKTTAEINKQSTEIKKVAASTSPLKKNLEDVDKATKQFTKDFMTGFQEGVLETLKEAGVSVEQFTNALQAGQSDAEGSTESLRQRLKNLTVQIAELKLRGEDNTEQFKQMVIEAGNIKDAIGDAAAEIKNAGSDTRTFDNLLGSAQAVAGGFAVAQGAAALFGDENEQLQETLVKVNATMAILQGLQQISNALEKEGAITKLGSTIATKGQIAAQLIYNAVVGTSIGLMKALRIAFALTGVGAVILGITALTEWLLSASKATERLAKDFTKFNLETARDLENFKKNLNETKRANQEQQADLKARGALQSQITRESIKGMKDELVGLFEIQKGMRARKDEAEKVLTEIAKGEREKNQTLIDESEKTIATFNEIGQQRLDIASNIRIQEIELEKQTNVERLQAYANTLQGRLALTTKNSKEEFDLTKQLAQAQASIELEEAGKNLEKRLLIERELQKRLGEIDAEAARARQQDRIAGAERDLLAVQERARAISDRTNQDEIDAQKKLILEKARLDLLQEGLTENAKLLIWENYLDSVLQLQKDFNKQSTKEALQDLISRNNADLTQLNITNSEKLALQEENLITQAQIEIDANAGLTNKIKEIRAKLNEDLRALRLAAIEKELEDELAATDVRTGVLKRANERIAADERKPLDARLKAINQLAVFEIAAINKREDALDDELAHNLISQEEYKAKYAKLVDDETKIVEDAEKKKTDLTKAENIKRAEIALQLLGQIGDIIQGVNETQAQEENDRIAAQKDRVNELLEAGAITEQEAAKRNKRIEAEEKKAKAAQAKREKDMAVFRALLAIPQAYLTGLSQGGLPLAILYAALAGVEAAIIASRPLPRFGHGKKSGYEGPAEIGETGAELYEQNGRMFLADKKQIVWLGAKDKVYNPTETKEMLMPVVDKQLMQWQAPPVQPQPTAREIASELAKQIKKMPSTNVNVDEHGLKVWVQEGLSRKNYMDKRYSSK